MSPFILPSFNIVYIVAFYGVDDGSARRTRHRISKPIPFVSAGGKTAVPAGSTPLVVITSNTGSGGWSGILITRQADPALFHERNTQSLHLLIMMGASGSYGRT